jgi:hypothetical protein
MGPKLTLVTNNTQKFGPRRRGMPKSDYTAFSALDRWRDYMDSLAAWTALTSAATESK